MRKLLMFAFMSSLVGIASSASAWEFSPAELLDSKKKAPLPRLQKIADDAAAASKASRQRLPERGLPAHYWLGEHDPYAVLFLMDQEPGDQDPHEEGKKDNKADPNGRRDGRAKVDPDNGGAASSLLSNTTVAVIFFVAGMIGWVALGVSAFILERRQAHSSDSGGDEKPEPAAAPEKSVPKVEPPAKPDGISKP